MMMVMMTPPLHKRRHSGSYISFIYDDGDDDASAPQAEAYWIYISFIYDDGDDDASAPQAEA
jgi:hypothetical protein